MSFLGDLSGSQALANMAGNLAQNSAMNQGQQAAIQQQQAAAAQQQAMLDNLYGSQGFGGQTAQYAGAGAAYGRATGGFNGGGGSVFDTGAAPYQDYSVPNFGAGSQPSFGGGNPTFSSWIQQQAMDPGSIWYDPVFAASHGGGQVDFPQAPASAPPAVPSGAQDWGAYFNNITAPAAAQPAYNPMTQYNSGGYDPYSAQTYAPAAQPNVGSSNPTFTSWIQQQAMDPGSIWYDPSYAASRGGGMQASGGDPSFLDAGKPGSSFNPYGLINSGQVGGSDPFYGYQPPAASFDQRFGMGFDPNSFANRFAAGGYYQPGTPSQISGYAPNGYDPFSGQKPPYTYQPGFVQGPGGPGDWVPQYIDGMNTLSPNDMNYRPAGSDSIQNMSNTGG